MDSSLASPFLLRFLLLSASGNSEMLEPKIISPKNGDFINVILGSPAEINCKATVKSEFNWVVWRSSRTDFLNTDEMLPVYYKELSETGGVKEVSLVIKQVAEEDLATNYSCILQGARGNLQVTIHLRQTSSPSYFLVLGVLGVLAVTVTVMTLVYVKMKLYIVLFLRDELGCYSRPSDAKAYDAYMMHYKPRGGAGLSVEDRRLLEELLEQKLGYTLCLYHRDVLPGQDIAKAVLDSIEQSRRLILVPCSLGQNQDQNQDCETQNGLLSGLHAALVERQTRLVLVQTASSPSESETDQDQEQDQDPLPAALCMLAQAGHMVTWQGASSHSLSSSFWRQLRYFLPARPRQRRLEPQRSITSHSAPLPHL